MKRHLKRCVSFLLVLILLFGTLPTAFAVEVSGDSTTATEKTVSETTSEAAASPAPEENADVSQPPPEETVKSGISGPVHLHDLTGLMIQMHGGTGFGYVVPVVLLEPGQLVGQFICRGASLAVLQPQQVQRDTVFLHLPVDILIIRHLVLRFACRLRKEQIRKLLI